MLEREFSNVKSYNKKGISTIDFIGLEFSEKKSKWGLPTGLNSGLEFPSLGPLPEVEIITRDAADLKWKHRQKMIIVMVCRSLRLPHGESFQDMKTYLKWYTIYHSASKKISCSNHFCVPDF